MRFCRWQGANKRSIRYMILPGSIMLGFRCPNDVFFLWCYEYCVKLDHSVNDYRSGLFHNLYYLNMNCDLNA